MTKFTILFTGLFIFSTQINLVSADQAECGRDTQVGDICEISILDAHPTQFSVGMLEVKSKQTSIEQMSAEKLKQFLNKHTIPTVIGPNRIFYLTDHHHLARALLAAGINYMNLDIQTDYSTLTDDKFWAEMESAHLVYLYDVNGKGPLLPSQLPVSVAHLADDVYRSLAWAVQKQTRAYADTNSPYASFLWANFFRGRILIEQVRSDFNASIQAGAKWAISREASSLPGYLGSQLTYKTQFK